MPNTASASIVIESPTGGVRPAVVPTSMNKSAFGHTNVVEVHESVSVSDVFVSVRTFWVIVQLGMSAVIAHCHAPFCCAIEPEKSDGVTLRPGSGCHVGPPDPVSLTLQFVVFV